MIWTELVCDNCASAGFGAGNASKSARELRAEARQHGWRRVRDTVLRDYCPACWKADDETEKQGALKSDTEPGE